MKQMMIQVKIELFGAFKRFAKHDDLELRLEPGTSLSDLRKALARALQSVNPQASHEPIQSLLESSAFADEKAILSESLSLDRDTTIAVLPPVCGG
ncbi:MAG: MoaD/ThiS family protein [Bdellovibrionia bacterium]